MYSVYKHIIMWTVVLAGLITAVACSDDQKSDLRLDGDTWITEISFDEYSGIINRTDKTVVVAVPQTYDASAMKLTSLQLSEGAESSMMIGEVVNLDFPQQIRVTNGDVCLDYTVTVKHDEAKILSFKLNGEFIGVINQETHAITVRVPVGTDITAMMPTITTNEGATVEAVGGQMNDYTHPVEFLVTYKSAQECYTVTVVVSDAPGAVYVGLAANIGELNPEEKAAAEWMLNNVENAAYISFADIVADNVDLSECKLMWWHLHIDGGIDNMDKFDAAAPDAVSAMVKVKDLYDNGMSLLLTRYGTYYAVKLGVTLDGRNPNNCWGQSETTGEIANNAWSFFIQGHETHPIYQGLIMNGSETDKVYTFDAGYRLTNSTAQWHLGKNDDGTPDWGGYSDLEDWKAKHGGIPLGYGGDGAVVAWEYPVAEGKGGILCIGSGCYDWYAHDIDTSGDKYHANIATLTLNAINYLTK